jgi:hypothetical protein
MKKRQIYSTRSVRRINLTLPIVRTDAYEFYYTVAPAQTRQTSIVRPVSRQKPVVDIASALKLNNQTTTTNNRSSARLKHLTGPVLVNLFVNMPPIPTDTSSTVADSISNALINSGYSGQTLRDLPSIGKHNKTQSIKDDGEQSQTTSSDRVLFESVGSFEDPFTSRTRNGMWHNVHHPQLSTIKILHTRKKEKSTFDRNDSHSRILNTISLGNLSQASFISTNDRLYEKVEQLTKSYFPSIQQLRHGHPCPELIKNRMHLHREEKRDFVPALFRSRVGR